MMEKLRMLFIDVRARQCDYKKGALSRAVVAQASAFYDRLFNVAILPDFRGESRQIRGEPERMVHEKHQKQRPGPRKTRKARKKSKNKKAFCYESFRAFRVFRGQKMS